MADATLRDGLDSIIFRALIGSLLCRYVNVVHTCFSRNITSQRHEHNDIKKGSVFSLCRYVHVVMSLCLHVHIANITT